MIQMDGPAAQEYRSINVVARDNGCFCQGQLRESFKLRWAYEEEECRNGNGECPEVLTEQDGGEDEAMGVLECH